MNDDAKERLYRKNKMRFTKKLRRRMTPEETILWELLRNRRSRGVKFRRQVNIGPYIADFLCKEKRVIIEVDGGIHETRDQREHDEARDMYLHELGYSVLRIKNEDIYNDIQQTLQRIHRFLQNTQQTIPSPPQRRGLG